MLRKLTMIVFGISLVLAAGSCNIYPLYLNQMMEKFNFTLKEVNLFGSFINAGLWMAFTMGLFYDKFGPKFSCILGAILLSGSYALLHMIMNSELTSFSLFPLLIIAFVMGQGSALCYTTAITSNLRNFYANNSAIVGLLVSNMAISPSIFTTYRQALSDVKIANYFLMISVFLAVVVITCGWVFTNIKSLYSEHEKLKEYERYKEKNIIRLLVVLNVLILVVYTFGVIFNNVFSDGNKFPNAIVYPCLQMLNFLFIIFEKFGFWEKIYFREFIEKEIKRRLILEELNEELPSIKILGNILQRPNLESGEIEKGDNDKNIYINEKVENATKEETNKCSIGINTDRDPNRALENENISVTISGSNIHKRRRSVEYSSVSKKEIINLKNIEQHSERISHCVNNTISESNNIGRKNLNFEKLNIEEQPIKINTSNFNIQQNFRNSRSIISTTPKIYSISPQADNPIKFATFNEELSSIQENKISDEGSIGNNLDVPPCVEQNQNQENETELNKFLQIISKKEILILFIILILGVGSVIANLNNIQFIISSISPSPSSKEIFDYAILYFVFNSFFRIFSGLIIDNLIEKNRSFLFLIAVSLLGFASQLLGISMDKELLFISTALAGATHGGYMTFTPIYSRQFGIKNMGKVLGFLTTGCALGSIIVADVIFLIFYEQNKVEETCVGKKCFSSAYIITSVLFFINVILSIILSRIGKKKY